MENSADARDKLLTDPAWSNGLLRRSLNGNCVQALVILVLAGHAVWAETRPVERVYFATNSMSEPVRMAPLSESVVSNADLLEWTKSAVVAAYTLNFLEYRQQAEAAKKNFSTDAWDSWSSSFITAGNLERLVGGNMLSTAVLTAAPVIREETVVNGIRMWIIQFPFVQTFLNNSQENSDRLMANVRVKRTTDPRYPRGIVPDQLVVGPDRDIRRGGGR
ncbi:DotI/IcmL/TraM family protein [Paeniroseomonas aquatica]|uniref:DotI/IcmL/TraM family protein n=1 Tax=Paeniroseomonas aquatica TaxID=373043 RepID=A0ABT8A045_9PROT|nr:DotI/IcmL/TraM family protein [Paeniroseomonas aquatica]MDN3563092.1 DotI/IcmL/TraM family protein [Paeniroseomonas aquatica]